MRLGIAHHLGWAVVVAATDDHQVALRRRIELIEPGLPAAPIHHEGGAYGMHTAGPPPDDAALAALVARVRASVSRTAAAALAAVEAELPEPVVSMSLLVWPDDFPRDLPTQRRVPYESRADSVMYREVLAEVGEARGWEIHLYDKDVEGAATRLLDDRADEVLHGPRRTWGPPWAKDHRVALAATILAASRRA